MGCVCARVAPPLAFQTHLTPDPFCTLLTHPAPRIALFCVMFPRLMPQPFGRWANFSRMHVEHPPPPALPEGAALTTVALFKHVQVRARARVREHACARVYERVCA